MARTNGSNSTIFSRWGSFVAHRPWTVLGAWAVAIATVVALMVQFGGSYEAAFALPGSESQQAMDLLAERFPAQSGQDAQLVFASSDGVPVTDPARQAEIEAIVAEASELPGLLDIRSPFEAPDAISDDGLTAFASLQYAEDDTDGPTALMDFVDTHQLDSVEVEAGGSAIQFNEQQGPEGQEVIGLVAAAIILLIAFGSIVAMGVPILTALVSLGASIALLGLGANFIDMTDFTPTFAAMIGLGVGIDYALLVVTRVREGLHRGLDKHEAISIAVDTAGRSVLFAGTVVIIAMLGLTVIGIPFVASLGIAAAIVVAMSVLSALTLMPAILALLGTKVDALSIPFLKSHEAAPEKSAWYQLSLTIQKRPWWFAGAGVGLLLLLAIPVLSMETNFTDAGNGSEELHSRRAYDLLKDGFGPGFNGPLMIAVDLTGASDDTVTQVRTALEDTAGLDRVSEPRINDAGDTAVIVVYPETGPQDTHTNALVHDLRNEVIPAVERATGAQAFVTGGTAMTLDLSDQITSRTPLFFAMVIGLSFVVLVLVFRSIVIPATAAVMNLLSIAAAYGVVVAVFQWGWLAGPLGINVTGPIETFLPMMMFAILFGLSMDYEVFLVSRIREEHTAGATNSRAIALGLSTTARVITSAALIMIAVFGSFILGSDRVIKEFGLGLAVAIFLDATIVRLLLVPAIMELFGKWNWWLPDALDRKLPAFDVEGSMRATPKPQQAGAAGD